ncbi:MAG TPA: nucleotide exchange factor GrpE [Xanthobacteraceae bacterium]|nr:nucleotide exchange factor GrpE [Xanthobacteraceae bacterium]
MTEIKPGQATEICASEGPAAQSANAAGAQRVEPSAAAPQSLPEPTPSERVEQLERELAETKDKLLRALAEMENLRRRTEREVADARTYGITVFARDILTVADNMHRALNALDAGLRERADQSVKALLDGVELTERELLNVLEKHGVKKLDPLGQKFDPNRHQAMLEVVDSATPPGHVAQVIQAGYLIGERVLRPALVAVAKSESKTEPPANDNSGVATS